MRNIGLYLREERLKKKISLHQMEKETKIKRNFIDSIEKAEWERLPDYSVTLGFVKTLAKHLHIPEENATAFFRRDYPVDGKDLPINPKPDLKFKSLISPKQGVILLSIFAGILFLGYLIYQYILYISPPKLMIYSPTENQEIFADELSISGKTQGDATLTVNNQKVVVSDEGEFSDKISIDEKTSIITFVARSRYGKETVIIRDIIPKL